MRNCPKCKKGASAIMLRRRLRSYERRHLNACVPPWCDARVCQLSSRKWGCVYSRASWSMILLERDSRVPCSQTQCNKMTCPNCATLSCYICRKVIVGYDHFSQVSGCANTFARPSPPPSPLTYTCLYSAAAPLCREARSQEVSVVGCVGRRTS